MNETARAGYEDQEKVMTEITKLKLIEDRKKDVEAGIVTLNQEFDRFSMESVMRDLGAAEKNANIKVITLKINSFGGSICALLPIIDWIERSSKPVITEVVGMAYSCGAMLLLSGTPGYRYANKYSDILLHEVAWDMGYGKASQQRHNAEYLGRLNKLLRDIIKRKTKMTDKDIARYMDSNTDIFIDAKTALKYGVIDKIL